MVSILLLRCLRACMTLLSLVYTLHVNTLPAISVVALAAYVSISAAITAFDMGSRRISYVLLHSFPFLCISCIMGGFSWFEWVACMTLSLPTLQSFCLIEFSSRTIPASIACSMLFLELVLVFGNSFDLQRLSIIHITATFIIIVSMISVLQPQFFLYILFNPLVLISQGAGVLAMYATRNRMDMQLTRQHTIGACSTLAVTYMVIFVVFFVSDVAGTAVLRVGPSYKHVFSAVQTYVGLCYPLTLTAAVNGNVPATAHGFGNLVINTLLALDQLFIPMTLIGPFVINAGWDVLALPLGGSTKWARIPLLFVTILFVCSASFVCDRLLNLVPHSYFRKDPLVEASYQMNSFSLSDDLEDVLVEEDGQSNIQSGKM